MFTDNLEGTADFGFEMEDLAKVAVRRQPATKRIWIEEGFVNQLGRRFEHAVKTDGVGVHDCGVGVVPRSGPSQLPTGGQKLCSVLCRYRFPKKISVTVAGESDGIGDA